MKRSDASTLLLGFACAVIFIACSAEAQTPLQQDVSQKPVIGVLDMASFQKKSNSSRNIQAILKQKLDAFQRDLNAEKHRLDQVREEAKKDERANQQLEDYEKHYNEVAAKLKNEMRGAEDKASSRIGNDLRSIVTKIAIARGFDLVFDSKTLPTILDRTTLGVLYCREPPSIGMKTVHDIFVQFNITDEVTQFYDQIDQGDYQYFRQL